MAEEKDRPSATTSMNLGTSSSSSLTSLSVPLAIGTLQWGTTWIDDKIINRTGVLSEATCQQIVDIVGDAGVTLFDTAEGYGGGTSEKRLGRLLSSSSSSSSTKEEEDNNSALRQQRSYVYMTKFLPAPWRAFHGDFETAARASCRRLGISKIDVYLLHSPVHWRSIEYWVEAAARCRQKGLIASMGLSNANADQVRRAVAAGKKYGVPVVCNQVHYSLLDYNSQSLQEMQKVCQELNVTIVGFSPIGQGLLTENLTDEKWATNKPAKMLRLQRHDIDELRGVLHVMADKYQKSMAQISLNWCIQHGVVPLVGCRSTRQAKDSVGCLGWSLKEEDVKALDAVALDKSTLDSPPWRRALFVTLFGIVHVVCRALDSLGFGRLEIKKNKKE